MTPRRLILLLLAIATIAATVLLRLGSTNAQLASDVASPSAAPGPTSAPANDTGTADLAHDSGAASAPSRLPVTVTADGHLGTRARVVGRCVGDNGEPLVDCLVTMHIWHLRHLGDGSRHAVHRATSDRGGRFVIELQPADPFEYAIEVRGKALPTMTGLWLRAQPGSTTDLGDLVVPRGVQVHGRVVDSNGAGVSKVMIAIESSSTPEELVGELAPRRQNTAVAREQGKFEFQEPLPPGEYVATIRGSGIADAIREHLTLTTATASHELVLVVPHAVDHERITGRVIDQNGRAIPGAVVSGDVIPGDIAGLQPPTAMTDDDGRFTLQRPAKTRADFLPLKATALGYSSGEASQRNAMWGSHGIELQLVRGGALTVRVTDPDGAPVETYWVTMQTPDGKSLGTGTDWQHDDGVAVVHGLHAGSWLVHVDFPPIVRLQPIYVPLRTTDAAATRIDVVAPATQERTVRVQFADGRPVARSEVRLFERFGEAMRGNSPPADPTDWRRRFAAPLLLCEATTRVDGRTQVRGPVDRECWIEVSGAEHCTTTVRGIRLGDTAPDTAEDDEIVVTVDEGATLRGRITPPEVLDELRRLCGLTRGIPFADKHRARLELEASDPTKRSSQRAKIDIGDDGSFAAAGLPVGACSLTLHCQNDTSGPRRRIAEVVLADGETTELLLDLSWLLPGTLEAIVLENGEPVRGRELYLRGERGSEAVTTDESGRFTAQLPAGRYRLEFFAVDGRIVPGDAMVMRGQTTRHRFEAWSARVRLRLEEPDGGPAADVPIMIRGREAPVGKTGSLGEAMLMLDAGHHELAVLPASFRGSSYISELRLARYEGRTDPFASVLVPIGEVTLQAGEDREVTLRLPPAWRD